MRVRTTTALVKRVHAENPSGKVFFENIYRRLPKDELSIVTQALQLDELYGINLFQCVFQLKDKEFCDALSNARCLTILELPLNHLNGESIVNLSQIIAKNASIETLNLNSNGFDDEGIAILSSALKSNKTLTKLQLNGNQFSEKGLDALIEALQKNNTLENIKLDEYLFPSEKIEKLHGMLHSHKHISSMATFEM